MNIVQALHEEETNLKKQLAAVRGAIDALNGSKLNDVSTDRVSNGFGRPTTLSAAGRAAISRAAKARWAKIRAQRTKKN
jgi:hypothetical protein